LINYMKHTLQKESMNRLPPSMPLFLKAVKVENSLDLVETFCSADPSAGVPKGLKALLEKDMGTYRTVEMEVLLAAEEAKGNIIMNQDWILDKARHSKEQEQIERAVEFMEVQLVDRGEGKELRKKKKKVKGVGGDLDLVNIEKPAKRN